MPVKLNEEYKIGHTVLTVERGSKGDPDSKSSKEKFNLLFQQLSASA